MKNINITVMGKTGAGKSTLINAVLEEELALTGKGQAVTLKNIVYSKQIVLSAEKMYFGKYKDLECQLNMYDTVGLEIDSKITDNTLEEIKKHIDNTRKSISSEDIHLVWFCVNDRSSRFESYEVELIKKLSIDFEIPFIVVLTQCFSDEEGELEKQIRKELSEVARKRVLAKDFSTRGGVIPAYGVDGLLWKSINDYEYLKVNILEKKISTLDLRKKERIVEIENKGKETIENYGAKAMKIALIPGACIPFIYGMCAKLIGDLNKIAGFKSSKNFSSEIFANVIVGIIAAPLMAVPLLSSVMAAGYVKAVGEVYLETLINVIYLSSDKELEDNELLQKRIKDELKKFKKQENL